jgi:endonuclease/exonuclease/phosphatase family metal-dependent hydrolase
LFLVRSNLSAKSRKEKFPSSREDQTQSIEKHIRFGSKPTYKSPWLSLTAELDVALAFAGVVSRIAVIEISQLEQEKIPLLVKRLDKEYLRSFLTDKDAVERSRRSDEVLVFGGVRCAKKLNMSLVGSAQRTLAPGFEVEDKDLFPNQLNALPKAKDSIGGSNKRMFRVEINGKMWVAKLPRPNYCLEKKVLFGYELVNLCHHQFATLCAYRILGASVPRCALYVFNMSAEVRDEDKYVSALILMEDFTLDGLTDSEVKKVAQAMFPVDVLLGNWECMEAVNTAELLRPDTAAFALTKDGRKTVRLSVDRALGCTYPEDRMKEDKAIEEFLHDNLSILRKRLKKDHAWCYGSIDERQLVQMTMDMKITSKNQIDLLKKAVQLSPGLPWDQEKNLWDILQHRMEQLLNRLPFYEVEPSARSMPLARDGHGAVCIVEKKLMFVFGGNSKSGPLKDLWKFNLVTKTWTRLENMPRAARYSFSMHLWLEKYIVIFGGCTREEQAWPPPPPQKSMQMLDDLLIYSVEEEKWLVSQPNSEVPRGAARGRQASHLVSMEDGRAKLFVLGGHDGQKKKKDVWQIDIVRRPCGSFSHKWIQWKDLKKETHRCFSFALKDKTYLVGGFGRSLRKIEEMSGSTVVTHDNLRLPASEKEQFMESESLAGFGAVYDEIGERLILIGGGNVGRSKGRKDALAQSKAFGNVPADVLSKPRILCLNHTTDSRKKSEWTWQTRDLYESLDAEHKLPNLLHWSAVYVDHSVVLFGGRSEQGNHWSNKVFKVQLRPKFKEDLQNVKETAAGLNCLVKHVSQKVRGEPNKEGLLREAAVNELHFLSTPMARTRRRKCDERTSLRVLSLNVHGWSSFEKTSLIDAAVCAKVDEIVPDVCCLQEVKHPFPAEPSLGQHIVQVSAVDKSALLRYSNSDSASEIRGRLNIPTKLDDKDNRFFVDAHFRNSLEYLDKVLQSQTKISCKPYPATALSNLSKAMTLNEDSVHFSPACDKTFGNAVICKNVGQPETLALHFQGSESRVASRLKVETGSNWELAVINVHLDHKLEETRMEQMRRVLQWLDKAVPHLLCGDLNAVSHWSPEVESARKELGFQPSTNALYQMLTETFGYHDLEASRPPRNTSIHGVRVDYILCSPALHPRLEAAQTKLHVIETDSDHSALLANIRYRIR